jgi:hypothetical protein
VRRVARHQQRGYVDDQWLGEVVVWAQSAKERGLTATFPPFLRLTILIKCRRNQQAHTADSSAIRREYARSNAKIFLGE